MGPKAYKWIPLGAIGNAKVDKTAKAVSTVSKQQVLTGLRGDQKESSTSGTSSPTVPGGLSPREAPPSNLSTTTVAAPPAPSFAGLPPRPPSKSSLGPRTGVRSSAASSAKSSTGSLSDLVQKEPVKTAPAKERVKVAVSRADAATEEKREDASELPVSTGLADEPSFSDGLGEKVNDAKNVERAVLTEEQDQPAAAAVEEAVEDKPQSQMEEMTTSEPEVVAEEQNETTSASTSALAAPQPAPAAATEAETEPTEQSAPSADSAEKIARLSRLVQGLKNKVERLQNENVQLEEMLAAADAAHRGGSGEISRLEDALAKEQASRVSLEAALNSAIAAKESEVLSLKQQLEASTARATTLAESLAAKEAERAEADAERSMNESQLISTLRKEVEAAEATLEEERKAHAASRRASAAREQELDASIAEAAASLSSMQRMVEERTSKAAMAEERCRELEHEVELLSQRAATAEAKVDAAAASGANGGPESSAAAQRIEELESTLAEVRRTLSASEAAATNSNEEAVRLRSEVETLKRQLAEARSSDSAELRRRLQEATDALYAKQAQLERITADRAAVQLQLERQLSTNTSDSFKRRTAAVDRMMTGGEDAYGIVPMDSLGDAYTRLANAPGHLGQAVKTGANFVDSTTSHAVKLLRHYPLGRLAVFLYLVCMHLFIYILMHRLQRRAFGQLAAAEAAEVAALHGNSSGP